MSAHAHTRAHTSKKDMDVEGKLFGKEDAVSGRQRGDTIQVSSGVNMIKVNYIHILKSYNEIHYFVLICMNKIS